MSADDHGWTRGWTGQGRFFSAEYRRPPSAPAGGCADTGVEGRDEGR